MSLETKFRLLATDNAPGQEVRQGLSGLHDQLRGEPLDGRACSDFLSRRCRCA